MTNTSHIVRIARSGATLLAFGTLIALGAERRSVLTLTPPLESSEPHLIGMTLAAVLPLAGAEIVCFDAATNTIFATCNDSVAMIRLTEDSELEFVRTLRTGSWAGFRGDMRGEVSHIALDPAGRGVVACTVVPEDAAGVPGAVVFFSTANGSFLSSVTVGYNPDAAAFTADGKLLVIANEGEPRIAKDGAVIDPPGSLSVIDVSGPIDAAGFGEVEQRAVRTVYPSGDCFLVGDPSSPDWLGTANRRPVRIHPRNRLTPSLDLEPESLAIDGRTVFVTLQENNAIGVFDLDSMQWTRIEGLGVHERIIDASDRDGGIDISTRVLGMPMPDQFGLFRVGARSYLLTADEGDTRGSALEDGSPLGDEARISDLADAGRLSPRALQELSHEAHRLHVCAFSGDSTSDGYIDTPLMFGARSATVWDAHTLRPLSSTGSQFERLMATYGASVFNTSSGEPEEIDSRSDNRGPEPEGVAIGEIDGRAYGFVTLERPGAIAALDLTDPRRVRVIGFEVCALDGMTGPEGIAFIGAGQSPSGSPLIVVACEGSGHVAVYRLEVTGRR